MYIPDVPSDHVLLVAEIKMKITNIKRHTPQREKDYGRLKNEDIRNKVITEINYKLTSIKPHLEKGNNINNKWKEMVEVMTNVVESVIEYKQKVQKQSWMMGKYYHCLRN